MQNNFDAENKKIAALLANCRSLIDKEKFGLLPFASSPSLGFRTKHGQDDLTSTPNGKVKQPVVNNVENSDKKQRHFILSKPKPACRCEKDPDMESYCLTFHRLFKRVDQIKKRTTRPRIILLSVNGKRNLIVENGQGQLLEEVLKNATPTPSKTKLEGEDKERSFSFITENGELNGKLNLNSSDPISNSNSKSIEFADSKLDSKPKNNMPSLAGFVLHRQQSKSTDEINGVTNVNGNAVTLPTSSLSLKRFSSLNNGITTNGGLMENFARKSSANLDHVDLEPIAIPASPFRQLLKRNSSLHETLTEPDTGNKVMRTYATENELMGGRLSLSRGRSSTNEERRRDYERENNDAILKDALRTFQGNTFFKEPMIQKLMRDLLTRIVKDFPQIGYVQGMNFVVGGIIYHCVNFPQSMKVVEFFFNSLELKRVYCMNNLETFVSVLKKLLKCHLFEFYSYFENIIQIDFKMLLLDWFFCLGLNKIPLDFSHILFENLCVHGWFYFYRLMVNYFRLFAEAHKKAFLKASGSKQRKFELELELKNFYRSKLDWESLLKKSKSSPLNDRIIESELHWVNISKFVKPGLICK